MVSTPTQTHNMAVGDPGQDFYRNIVDNYEVMVNRFVPGYVNEIVPLVTDLISRHASGGVILDLGCGTGNVDQKLIEKARPRLVDCVEVAGPMIQRAKEQLTHTSTEVKFHHMSATEYTTFSDTYDAVLSNLVIHNIPLREKQTLISKIYSQLKQGGLFVWTDLVTYDEPGVFDQHLENRKRIALDMGATEEFAEENFAKERDDDHVITLEVMKGMLETAGFNDIELEWEKHNAVVITARK